MDEIITRICRELVPVIDQFYSQLGQPALEFRIANNISFIEHTSAKNRVADMYQRAHPHPLTGVQPNITYVRNLSKFLQMQNWYPCTANNPKCTKSQVVHRPDLAMIFQEPSTSVPLNSMPWWGRYEQEHKALEEATSTLAFMPDTFLLFIYHNRFEFWYLRAKSS